MSELDPALFAALQAPRLLFFSAVEIITPEDEIRLLDGSAETEIEGQRYFGSDPDWGVLSYAKGITDSDGDSSPAPVLGMVPSSLIALDRLLDPALQGSSVRIMIGVMDRLTGLPIGTMYEPFTGELDVPKVKWDRNSREVEFTLAGIGERLFQVEEGKRLSDAFHQTVWPNELGLAFVTDVETSVPWGAAPKGSPDAIRSNQYGGAPGFGSDSGGGQRLAFFGRY